MTHRSQPIYLSTSVGKPPMEDRWLGEAVQQMVGPLIRLMRPEVRDLWAYYETGFHNLLVVSVHQRYEKEAMKTALGLLGDSQLSLTKVLVLVDPGVNVRSIREVWRAIGRNFDAREDLLILPGVPMDTLDFTGPRMNLGSKMIVDATRRTGERPPPSRAEAGLQVETEVKRLDARITGCRVWEDTLLAVQVQSGGREVLERVLASDVLAGVKWVAAVSPDVDLTDDVSLLWGLFTRFDAARDVQVQQTRLAGPVPVYEGRLGIDATWKPGYPPPLEMPAEVVDKVRSRWEEYGL